MTFDTSILSDGQHELSLEIYDATAVNKAVESWTILVDNNPPAVGDVAVTGAAREGEALQCAASVEGQTPRTAYQWSRANADGSDEKDITGATAATYTLMAEDVGKKVLCRVTGTDGGGSATKKSTLTSGPFAGGAVVVAKSAPPPTGTTQTGATGPAGSPGTNGPAGGNGAAGSSGASGATGAAGSSGGSGTAGAAGGGSGSGSTGAAGSSGGSGTNGPAGPAGPGAAAAVGAAGGSVGAAAAAAVAAAVPKCTTATVSLFGTVTSLTRSYNRSSVPLSGKLIGAAGEPRAGRELDLIQTVVRAGAAQRTKVGSVRSGADGTFRVTAPPGPSRALQLVEAGCGAVGPIVTERVRGAIQARTTTRRIRNRQTARFKGRVLGGYVGRGIPLELQVKVGRQWRDVKHTTSNARGEYRLSYRFLRTYVRYTYRFRVVTRAGGGWPYMPARSRVVKVRVN